jgi:hypothetical protein
MVSFQGSQRNLKYFLYDFTAIHNCLISILHNLDLARRKACLEAFAKNHGSNCLCLIRSFSTFLRLFDRRSTMRLHLK